MLARRKNMKCVSFYKILFNSLILSNRPQLQVYQSKKQTRPDHLKTNINQVQDYEVQELNDGQFLSELTSMMEVPDEDAHEKENISIKKKTVPQVKLGQCFKMLN